MNPVVLLKITENDKRVIIALLFVIIICFVVIGLLGSLIVRTMKWQSKKCDTLVSDVVTNRIVTTPHQLRKYAAKKNVRYFIKQAWIPIIVTLVGVATLLIRDAVMKDFSYNPFNMETGFGSLFFVWDFSKIIQKPETGAGIILSWPVLVNSPHFVVEAIPAYVSLSFMFVGGAWYLVAAQAYLARTLRAMKLSKTVFEKSLENFNQNTPLQQPQVDPQSGNPNPMQNPPLQ